MAKRRKPSSNNNKPRSGALNFEPLEQRLTPVAPSILANGLTPTDNSLNFALDGILTLEFDRPIKFGAAGTVSIFSLGDSPAEDKQVEVFNVATSKGTGDGKLSISGTKLTINPTDSLLANATQYYVSIDKGAVESSEQTIVNENFDGATTPALPANWTKVDGFNNPPAVTGGNAEWDGWVTADAAKWRTLQAPTDKGGVSNYDRNLFTFGSGNIAIADTQLWANVGDPTTLASAVDSSLRTPTIPLATVTAGAGQITVDFVSSFRPTVQNAKAVVEVSFDGGTTFQATPIFSRTTQNAPNEKVSITLDNPATGDMVLRFRIEDAISSPNFQADARWWAIDNLVVSGKLDPDGPGDGDDFAGINDRSRWNFATVGLDTTAPSIVSITPVDGAGGTATDVPVDANLQITFSENVVAGFGYVLIRRLSDNAVVQAIDVRSTAVTIAGNVATINPPADLADSVEYYVQIQAGAFRDTSRVIQTPIYNEDFESLPLGPFITETDLDADGKDWTNVPPSGWTIDNVNVTGTDNRQDKSGTNKGVPGLGSKDVGAPEWQGWTFADKNEWAVSVGDQGRTGFTAGEGTVAVADPDEWDDLGSPANLGSYNTLLATPVVPLAKLLNNPVLTFDSSYRNEADTDVFVEAVYYDNTNTAIGAPSEILFWSWNPALPSFKPDALSETVSLPLTMPTGTAGVSFNFIMRNARNDWWWAIDNVRIQGEYLAGNTFSLNNNTDWNFKTLDKTAPVIRALSPADDSGNVADSAQLTISFDDNVQLGTSGTISILRLSDNSVVESFNVLTSPRLSVTANKTGGNSVVIAPTNPLPLVTNLYVLITPGAIENIAGVDFAGIDKSTVWNFATAGLDTTKPTISALSPADNSFNVLLSAPLVMTFSENIVAGDGSILIRDLASGSIVSGFSATDAKVSISGNKATINATGVLQPGTDYYIEVTPGAFRDEAANFFDGISGKSTWNFLTGASPLGINSFVPLDNSANVAVGSNLIINFGSNVVKGKGNIDIRRVADGSVFETIDVQSGLVTVSGSSVTINPTNDLEGTTAYFVEAAPGTFVGINPTSVTSVVFFENFEGQTLYPFQSPGEGNGDGTDWTSLSKAQTDGKLLNWDMSTGSTPVGNPVEFFGWTLMDVDSWTATEGNQGRAGFTLGGAGKRGTIFVADGDAYDDGTDIDTGKFEASLSVTLPLTNIDTKTASVIFDSSWQAEPTQRGKVEVSFDGGANNLIIDFSGDSNDALFKPTALNETLEYALNNPSGASQMKITWTYYQASNDWWWAIDNVRVRAKTFEAAFQGISGTDTWNFFTAGTDTTAPTVIALNPTDEATNVTGKQDLVMTFSEPIQFGTTGKITVLRQSDNVPVATFDVSVPVGLTPSTNKLTINPPSDLAPLTAYYVRVDAGAIRDLAGNNFAGIADATTWNFSTSSLTPIIVSLTPADNSVGAPNINPQLQLTFDRVVRRGTGDVVIRRLSDNTVISNVEVRSAQVNIVNNTVFVNFNVTLQELTDYYVEVAPTAFADELGNAFAGITGNSTWNFTTRENVVPTLVSLSPADNSTNVAVGADLKLTFSENVFAGTGKIQLLSPSGDVVIESFDVKSSTQLTFTADSLTINPTNDLLPGKVYFLRVPNGAIVDVYGNKYVGFTQRSIYNFETAPTDPVVVSFSPTDNKLNVPVDSKLVVTFSEPIQLGTAGNVIITDSAGTVFATYDVATAPAELIISGSTLTIDPATDFAASKGYFVTITAGAITDTTSAAFAGIANTQTWNFYTGSSDTTAPTVTSIIPADNATNVTKAAPIVLEFSEDVVPGVGFITIFNATTDAIVTKIDVTSAQVVVTGKTVTVDAQNKLPEDGGKYYVLVSPGAFQDTATATGLTLFAEDFEGLPQQPFPDRGANAKYDGTDWTPTAPAGWVLDTKTSPTNGSPTYKGWTFLDIDSWVAEAGQNRGDFVLGGVGKRGTVAVADGDQYEDGVGVPADSLNFFMSTPSINLSGVTEDTVTLAFFSSFRPESKQEGIVEVSYDGGVTFAKVFSRLAEDKRNEQVVLNLDTPAGATSLIARFGYINADNNWWWAVDNIVVTGNKTGTNTFSGITDKTAWDFVSVDTTAPLALSFTPADNKSEVRPESNLVVGFDDEMNFGTGTINVRRSTDNSIFASYTAGTSPELTITGKTLTINPSTDLESFTGYYLEISNTALADTDGNAFAGISDPEAWNFTTLDVAGPTLVSTTPADDSLEVGVAANLTLTFNENIQVGSGLISIFKADGTLVESYEASTSNRLSITGSVLTIDPTADLPDATEFYVQIAPTAIRDFSNNLGGNAFAGIADKTSFSFSTNNAPVVNDQSFSIDENSTATTLVGAVVATDAESTSLTYSILSGNAAGAFAIDSATGKITVADASKLNFESTASYTLSVQVSDTGAPLLTDTATITITVNDLNETPTIDDASFTANENLTVGSLVGSVTGTDPDTTAPNNTLTYSITAGNALGAFAIDGSTGKITVADASKLDFETTPSFTLTVQAADGGTTSLLDTATVTITLNDLNETPTLNDASFSIDENTANGTLVGTVTGTDPDTTAPNNTLTYSITAGNSLGAFAIDGGTGKISIADASKLNFETAPSFSLTVQVADGGTTSLTDNATVTINLNDLNETPTVNDVGFTVSENAVNGTLVGTVVGTDPDSTAPNNTLTYSITAGNGLGAFAIDGSTGKITVADASKLNFETTPSFSLTVQATDAGTPGLSDTATITITASDLNEAPNLNDISFTVNENLAAGSLVGTLVGTDPDASAPNNTLTYSITAGNASGAFAINASTGKLTVADASKLNFETAPSFALTVQVTDAGTPSLSDTAIVTINLNDLNEAPTLNDASFSVDENSSVSTVVGTLVGSDPDSTAPNNTLTYSITAGNSSGAFAIDGSTGKLTVADASKLNFEATTSFVLTVQVADAGTTSLSDTATVTINLNDLNETPTLNDVSYSIDENVVASTLVGTLVGSDPDTTAPNNTLTYSITAGNSSGAFAIDASTGKVTVADASKLNFEASPSFALTVQVADAGSTSLTDTATVTINLNDLNEAPTLNKATFSVNENASNVTAVGTVKATDPDTTAPNTTLSYSITSGNESGAFAINPSSGLITVANGSLLNFESKSSYSLTVQAKDGGGLTSSNTVAINLTDVNETPVLDDVFFEVPENSAAGTVVGLLAGVDPDTTAPNKSLTYVIVSGNESGAFGLNSAGQLTVADGSKLNFEGVRTFTLGVRVNDGGAPSLSDIATVRISLTNVNENPVANDDTASTLENEATTINVLANDTDVDGNTLTISSVAQPANGQVVIQSGGKNIQYTPNKNFSGSEVFSYTISDGQGGTATAKVTVTVTDVPLTAGSEFAVGTDVGAGTVRFMNADRTERFAITPFGADFTGGVRTASADFNGDGVNDLVVGTGPGRATQVRVLDGKTQTQLFSVDPFEASFKGGVYVAVGDMNGDGVPELAITPDEGGGPRVRVFSGKDFGQIADFFGINDPNFRGGARPAIGDITGDGVADLVIAAGFGGGPRIGVFDGAKLSAQSQAQNQTADLWETWKPFPDFFAFEQTLRNGTFVAVGDTNGDGKAELIAGGGPGGGPRVSIFGGNDLLSGKEVRIADFFAGNTENRGGIRVSIKDLDGDSQADLLTGSGTGGGSTVTGYAGKALSGGDPANLFELEAYPGNNGGVFVG
jgi:methionine-rich copper-binding protein CopC